MAARSSDSDSERFLPGEPGVATDLPPPFVADDGPTRWLFSLNRFGIRPGLSRIEHLLAELDHPERDVPSLVVAGTNGKGSTTLMLAALLRAAGYRVGCFTSPHLLQVYERIMVDDRPCARELFAEMVRRLRPAIERCGASWFESLTALALEICRRMQVDFLCCETGLGGRLDATNALPAVATLLTSVSMDHGRILGDSLQAIAAEKLGLLKEGVPVFCAVKDELRAQVFQTAVRAGSPCYFLDEQARWRQRGSALELVTRRSVVADLPRLSLPVLSRNQALAWLCVEELSERGVLRRPADPARAMRAVFLPGRYHRVIVDPDWIFDTAHNTEALSACLDAFLAQPCRGRRLVFFGCMRDKELAGEVGERLRRCDGVVAVPISLPRSRNPGELSELLEAWGLRREVIVAESLAAGLMHLAGRMSNDDRVLVTGSCFLVAETLHELGVRDLDQTRRARPAREMLAPFGKG